MAAKEKVEIADTVEARIVTEQASILGCPRCRSIRFRLIEYIEVRADGSATVAITEYECMQCDEVHPLEGLLVTSRR